MTTRAQAAALIISGQVYLQRYVAAKKALDETKAIIGEYLDEEGVDELPGLEAGSGARWVQRSERTLHLDQMPDELIVAAARRGLLRASISKLDELTAGEKEVYDPYVSNGEGARYVNLYYPSWSDKRREEKAAREPDRKTPAPQLEATEAKTSPAPAGQGKGLTQTPTRPAQAKPTPIRQAAPDLPDGEWVCPDHPARQPKESNWGGLFCTAQADDGYCQQTSRRKAS